MRGGGRWGHGEVARGEGCSKRRGWGGTGARDVAAEFGAAGAAGADSERGRGLGAEQVVRWDGEGVGREGRQAGGGAWGRREMGGWEGEGEGI